MTNLWDKLKSKNGEKKEKLDKEKSSSNPLSKSNNGKESAPDRLASASNPGNNSGREGTVLRPTPDSKSPMNEGPSGTVLRPGSGFKPSATAGPGRKSSDLDSFQEINPGRTWEPGEIIEGRYQVINELTGGAMGQVYRVKHKTWNIELAIKSPQPHLIANEALKTRFIQEAESWVELGLHPHITTCYYVTQIEGIPRIVLEYVEGGTLKQWIARGAFFQDWEAPLGVAIQFCLGLEYAHSKGVVHRDLKPANVLMTKEGTPKLTDFGLVKRGSGTDYQGSLGNTGSSAFDPPYQGGTMVGTVLGTPEYMAPEQWIGAEQTGTHTDIYAVGVVLYELFCGRRPFEISESLQYAHPSLQEREWKRMHTEEPIPNPHQWRPDIPESLVILLRECLAKAPSDRPISVTAVRERLEVTYQIHLGRTAPYTQAAAGLDFRADNLNNRALSYMDLGKEAEAEAIWRDALAADPQHAEVIYNLGVFLWRRGRLTDNALVRQLEEVRATHSNQWQAMYLLALVQLERGEAELAYLLLGEAVRRTSGEAELQAPLQMARSRVFTTRRFTKSFEGHSNSVSSVCISKDGRWALSGSADTTLRLWDISTGQCVRVFHGHNNYVSSVSMSADGRLALSGSSDNTLQLWEVATGRRMRTFEGHLKGITSVSLSADGRLGLSGSWDKTIQLWDIVTGIWLKTFEGHTKEVLSVSLSADGRWALSGSSDNTVQLWDITTGQSLRTFKGHTREVTVVCLSPDGRWALSGSSDKTIMLWDTVKGQCVRTFEGHTNSVTSLYISAEGRWILSGSRDNTLRLWEVATGRCLRTFQGHTDWVTSVCLSPDGNWALSGSGDHTLRLWKLPRDTACIPRLSRPRSHKEWLEVQTRSGALLKKAGEALEKMNYSEALHLVQEARQVPGCERTPQSMEAWTKLSLICPRIGLRSAWLARTFEKSENEINAISMSTDGQLAISGGGNDIQVWDVATGRCLRSFPGHANSVLCVYMSPDGRWALSGGGDNVMRLWDVTTGRCVRAFQGHIHWVRSVRLSPDGRWALSCGGNSILLWEVNTGRCARTFLGHTNSVLSVSWSEDGRWVLSGGGDNTIRLWDVATGRCIRTFQGHTSWVRSVCFSTDGRWILSGGADNTVRLWQTETGNCLKVFQEHTDGVNSVCLSADGRWAFSGGSDSTVRFWQLSKGDQTRVFRGHASWVRSVCISSDGRWVLSGGGDKMIRLWQMDWELEARDLATWNEGALPFLKTFLTLHTPYTSTDLSKPEGFTRSGKPSWNEQEFEGLIRQLQQAGYGRLRHEGVRAKLEELARE